MLKLGRLCQSHYSVPQFGFVVKEVKRASIIDKHFNLVKRPSTAYDVCPGADFHEKNAFHKVGRRVFELERLFLDHFLKFEPTLFLVVDVFYFF